MTPKMDKGLCLRRETQKRNNLVWLLNALLATGVCCVLIRMLGELTGIWDIYTPVPMLLSGCLVCLIGHILERINKRSWFYPVALAVLLVLILVFPDRMTDGIALIRNRIGEIYTLHTGWVVPGLTVVYGDAQNSLLLVSCIAGCLLGLLCTVPKRIRWIMLAVLLPGVLLAGVVLLGRTDLTVVTFLTLGLSALLLIHNGSETRGAAATAAGCAAAILLTGVIIPVARAPKVRQWGEDFTQQLHENHHMKQYETGFTVLPEGDLTQEVPFPSDAVPGLVVTMDQPERMYFRGFVGERFQNDVWKALDRTILAENREMLCWLNLYEFQLNQQFYAATSGLELTENTITVQNIGACSEMYYLPFNMSGGMKLEPENLNTMVINESGKRIYVFSALTNGADWIQGTLNHLEESEDQSVLAYRKAESAYREYVYEHYVQIPEEVELLLKEPWDACKTQGELSSEEAQLCVIRFLELCYPEDGKTAAIDLPAPISAGTSFQRATVEVMTLRYFGIPARYAEGYVLTAQMAQEADPGEPIRLDSSCACAWAEIYQDGIGWIPVDLSRMAEESEDQKQDDDGIGSDAENPDSEGIGTGSGLKEGQELEETIPETEPEAENPDTDFELELPDTLIKIVMMILTLLLLVLMILLIRYWILTAKREKRYHTGTDNDAAAYLFADTAQVLAELGFDRGNGSVSALYQPVGEAFGDEYAGKLRDAASVNAQAMFSSRMLPPEQKARVAVFRDDTVEMMKKSTTWVQRLRLKWIRCLY